MGGAMNRTHTLARAHSLLNKIFIAFTIYVFTLSINPKNKTKTQKENWFCAIDGSASLFLSISIPLTPSYFGIFVSSFNEQLTGIISESYRQMNQIVLPIELLLSINRIIM